MNEKFKNTELIVNQFAKDVVDASLNNQKKNKIIIKYEAEFSKNSFSLEFKGPKYTAFQDQGVSGHGKGSWTPKKPKSNKAPNSPFKYKTGPGQKTILESLVMKPMFRTRDINTGRFTPKTQSNMNSASFLIARSIGRFGIPGKMFFTNAVKQFGPGFTKRLGEAWVKDQQPFIKSIQDQFTKEALKNSN